MFTSQILPRFLRRIPSIDNLIPVLYLKGISTGDFPTALTAILGDEAKGVSASTVVRLKSIWESEYKEWLKRDLSNKQYVYFWVDGIYCNVRMEEKSCILVIIAADEEGNKELLAIDDGFRESMISWKEILLSLKDRGLQDGPKLAIGDGALGFWAALREVFPNTEEQRCWVHKTANVLDKLPKTLQAKAKNQIHEMYMAENKKNALLSYERFIGIYKDKYPKAVNCLEKDKDRLFTFYDYPAVHWTHIRTTNPIESTFSTVRHRSYRTKNCGNRVTTLTMVYKLVMESQKNWHKLKGYEMIPLVLKGKIFKDGVLKEAA
jgi:transposase-like protein